MRDGFYGSWDLSLKSFLDIRKWQKIQDNFSAITGVALRTIEARAADAVTQPSGLPGMCKDIRDNPQLKDKVCGNACLPTFLGGRGVLDKNLRFTCHAGFYNFIIPLRAENNVLGYIILGPVFLVMRRPKEDYQWLADELMMDLAELWGMLLEVKVVSVQGAQSLVELIRDIGEYTVKLAYQNMVHGKGVIMAPDAFKLSRLLNALLEVAFQVTGADVGSVMFFKKDSDELTIRAARGIPEDIVQSTRVRSGEGISGIAAKERKSFLIDENIKDNRIRNYLSRPYLSSSMVIPIDVKEKTVGVMNLGALQTSPVRFNPDTLKMTRSLVDLTTIALRE